MINPQYPVNHQGLFLFAIKSRCTVIGEFYSRQHSWRLWNWARKYAKYQDLVAPVSPKEYGLYYLPDDEEETELCELGLLPEDWEAIKANDELWW